MKMLVRAALALLALSACAPLGATVVTVPQVLNAGGQYVPALAVLCVDQAGAYVGCGGSGGGGSGLGGLANAAAPSYTEGGTLTNLSFDLNGYQRVRAKQDGAWTVGVTGTFWQTTQPVSASALPLPSGAAIATNQLANVAWADQDAQTLASSATYSGTSRDSGVAAGTAGNRAYFNAVFISNQTGTAAIQGSSDGSTWVSVTNSADGALTASTPLVLTVPVLFRYYRAVLVNGATSATITVHTSYTGA